MSRYNKVEGKTHTLSGVAHLGCDCAHLEGAHTLGTSAYTQGAEEVAHGWGGVPHSWCEQAHRGDVRIIHTCVYIQGVEK